MADLARSVSHDLNNALGATLPLIQQMQTDLQRGVLSPTVFGKTSNTFRSRSRSAVAFSVGC